MEQGADLLHATHQYDTMHDHNPDLTDWSRRRLAKYHRERSERFHKAMFPIYAICLAAAVVWAIKHVTQ